MKDPTQPGYISTDNVDLLNSRRLPARLTIHQTAFLFNMQVYEVLLLMRRGLLKCLGAPKPNSRKYFSSAYILKLAESPEWLSEATKAIAKAVREKNGSHQPRSARLAA